MSGLCQTASCFQFYFFLYCQLIVHCMDILYYVVNYLVIIYWGFGDLTIKKVLFLRNPDSSVAKESTCNAGDPSCSIPGLGRSPGEVIGYSFQYSWATFTFTSRSFKRWEKARVGCFERMALKHVYYLGWNRSPAQAGYMRQVLRPGALERPEGSGREGGGRGDRDGKYM